MKALTIKQPWAYLIIHGGKDIENRDWKTNYRGIVAIHSSAKLDRDEVDSARNFTHGWADPIEWNELPCGVILGTVEIVGCVSESESKWFCGEYGFELRNPVAFREPIPCKGALGFWEVPEHVTAKVGEQYKAAISSAVVV